jgi:hypothetical protein
MDPTFSKYISETDSESNELNNIEAVVTDYVESGTATK